MVTHWAHNPGIAGSIPAPATKRSDRLAGLGHLPFTEKITGSNPVRTTKSSLKILNRSLVKPTGD